MKRKQWLMVLVLALFASPAFGGGSDTGGPQDEGSAPRPEGNEPRMEIKIGPVLDPLVRLGGIEDIGPKSR